MPVRMHQRRDCVSGRPIFVLLAFTLFARGWCPCAVCQGHGGERHFIQVENPQLVSVGVVGNYALNPRWSDGHETGIYSFQYLRDLCEK